MWYESSKKLRKRMIIILKCFLSFLNVLLACGFATFAHSSMLLPSLFPTICLRSLPHYCWQFKPPLPRQAGAAAALLLLLTLLVAGSMPTPPREEAKFTSRGTLQGSKGEHCNFRLVLAFLHTRRRVSRPFHSLQYTVG